MNIPRRLKFSVALAEGSLFRSIGKILSGTAVAQILALLGTPILSRLYSPAEFGDFTFTLAIVTVGMLISTLQLNQAIVLPKSDRRAYNIFVTTCVLSFFGGSIVAAVALVFQVVTSGDYSFSPILIGLAIYLSATGQAMHGLATRHSMFSEVAISSIARVIVTLGVQVVFGIFAPNSMALLVGFIAGELVAAFLLLSMYKIRINSGGGVRLSINKMYAVTKQYKDFVLFGTAQEVLNSTSQNLPIFLLNAFFGASVSGAYAFAARILQAPANLIGSAVRSVLMQRFSSIAHDPRLFRNEFQSITALLMLIGGGAALLASFAIPSMFTMLFGSEWALSGQYGKWLVVWCAFLVINVPASVVFRTLRKQQQSFYINIGILISRLCILLVGGLYVGDMVTIAMFAIVGIFANLFYIYMAWNFFGIKKSSHGKEA